MTKLLRTFLMPVCILLTAGTLLLSACAPKKEQWSNIPEITFTGLSADSIKAPSTDQILLSFTFKDGDGNLGVPVTSGNKDVYLIDSRDEQYNLSFFFPQDITRYVTAGSAISGSCNLYIPAAGLETPSRPSVKGYRRV
ncbi:MAG: hypothetical protein QM743_11060 [Chitinophagaceae bacterium]